MLSTIRGMPASLATLAKPSISTNHPTRIGKTLDVKALGLFINEAASSFRVKCIRPLGMPVEAFEGVV